MPTLGKAYVQIVPSADGISGSIQNVLGGEVDTAGQRAGESLGSKLADTFKKVFIAAGIGKAITASLNEGGALQQSIGGVETLFKDSSEKVKEYASEAFRTTGLSANEYMQTVTGFSASLLQSLGGDTDKAADIANTAMVDMADNANKMGTSMEAIQNAYAGFAKQNYTMLDNLKLGYGGTKTEMERLLKDASKLTGVEYDIKNLSDVYEAIHVIQGEIGITGTTAEEASETLQGSFSAMKASAQDLLGALSLGDDITPQLEALATTTTTWLFGNLIPMVTNIIGSLPTLIGGVLQTGLPLIFEQGLNLINQFSAGIASNLPALADAAMQTLTSFTGDLSGNLGLIITAGMGMLMSLAEGLLDAIPELLAAVPQIIGDLIRAIIDNLPKIIQTGMDLLVGIVEGISEAMPQIFDTMFDIVGELLKIVTETDWLGLGIDIVKGIIKGVGQMGTALWESLKGIAERALNKVKSFLGIGSPSKVFADQVGQWIPEGVAVGVETNTQSLTDAMDDMARDALNVPVFDTIRSDRAYMPDGFGGSATTNNLGGVTINIYADQYNNDPIEIGKAVQAILVNGMDREEAVFG